METRYEQISKKIKLSKVIDMTYIIWETTIDVNTVNKLKEEEYSVVSDHQNRYYHISW